MSVDPAGHHRDGSGCCSEEISERGYAHEPEHRVQWRGTHRQRRHGSLTGNLTPLAVKCTKALAVAALVLAVTAAEHSKKVELLQEETRKMEESGLNARSGQALGLCGGLRRRKCGMHDGCSWCVSREEGKDEGKPGKEKDPESSVEASHPGKENCVPWGQCSWPLSLCELKAEAAECAAGGKNPGSCTWCSSQSRCVSTSLTSGEGAPSGQWLNESAAHQGQWCKSAQPLPNLFNYVMKAVGRSSTHGTQPAPHTRYT